MPRSKAIQATESTGGAEQIRNALQDFILSSFDFEWVVIRNRLSHINTREKRDVGRLPQELAKRIGFRQAPGFGGRMIFREQFTKGLTL